MATVGKITVAYNSGPSSSVEVDYRSNMAVDGAKTSSGGGRPIYAWGPTAAGSAAVDGNGSGFCEYQTSVLNHHDSEITSISLSGSTLTVVVTTQGRLETTHATVDASSVLVVDGPGRTGHGSLGGSRVAARIPLALASSVSYVAATAP